MNNKLKEKEEISEKLEAKVVSLKRELDKSNKNLRSSQILDIILCSQKPPHDKSGLGYISEFSNLKEDTSAHHEEKPRIFVYVLKGSHHNNALGNKVQLRNERWSLPERNISSRQT